MGTPAPPIAILSLAAAQDKNKLASKDPWILLLDVNWQGTHLRVARNTDAISFDAGDGLGVQTYQPFVFDLSGYDKSSNGQLQSVQLKVSNVNRLVQGLLESFLGIVGATATLYAVNLANPTGEADLAIQFTILQSSATAQWVTFTLGAPSPLRQLFPRFTYRPDFCMWVVNYKGPQCLYAGPNPSCDGTLNGPNGCTAHNNNLRFGAFPGIGTNGGVIASQI